MSSLVAIVFNDQTTAFEMRAALAKMQRQYLLTMEDAAVVTRDENGKVRLHEASSLTAAGAVHGAFWGMLLGLLFLNPLLGAAVGAGAGAIAGKFTNIGIDNKMMKDIGDSLKPGTSALFVLARRVTAEKVLDGLKEFAGKGRVFQTSLDKDDERALREALEAPPRAAA
jgi:uncharacterized membrane protein